MNKRQREALEKYYFRAMDKVRLGGDDLTDEEKFFLLYHDRLVWPGQEEYAFEKDPCILENCPFLCYPLKTHEKRMEAKVRAIYRLRHHFEEVRKRREKETNSNEPIVRKRRIRK